MKDERDPVEVIEQRFRALGLPRADCKRIANEALHALEAQYAVITKARLAELENAGRLHDMADSAALDRDL